MIPMSMFIVDDNCIRCGLCSELCVARIVERDEGGKPFVAAENERKCIRCGQCVSFCPKSCCYLDFQRDRVAVDASLFPAAESAETFLRSRRSIRKFRPDPVPEGLVRRIVETARYAPTAQNLQPVHWVIAMEREKLVEFGEGIAEYFEDEAARNPDDSGARIRAQIARIWRKGHDILLRNAPQLAIALVKKTHPFPEDGAIALTYFELAAHAHHVGCTWAGFFTAAARQSEKLATAVGVRDDEFLVGAQMFGYADGPVKLSRILPPRKEIEITLI